VDLTPPFLLLAVLTVFTRYLTAYASLQNSPARRRLVFGDWTSSYLTCAFERLPAALWTLESRNKNRRCADDLLAQPLPLV
jgi:hypothetical protein